MPIWLKSAGMTAQKQASNLDLLATLVDVYPPAASKLNKGKQWVQEHDQLRKENPSDSGHGRSSVPGIRRPQSSTRRADADMQMCAHPTRRRNNSWHCAQALPQLLAACSHTYYFRSREPGKTVFRLQRTRPPRGHYNKLARPHLQAVRR